MKTMLIGLIVAVHCAAGVTAELPERIVVARDGRGFELADTRASFTPWGFNYDHDEQGRLIEDYWSEEWPKVAEDFQEMKDLGANVVRIHLQYGRVMESIDRPNTKTLERLQKLLRHCEELQIYLDITGLGCYHKQDVPEWYDDLSESDRWKAQANFWRAVGGCCRESPAVFCYDLMNEPVVPGGKRAERDWLGPPFAGKHFVQVITLDQSNRQRVEIAAAWIEHLARALREVDDRHLVTVGFVDWSLDKPGLTSGFIPTKVASQLDFLCVHIYPEGGKLDEHLQTLQGFNVGKPVVIEETFPLKCSVQEFTDFVEHSKAHADGWIGFYWGKTLADCKASGTIPDSMLAGWLEYFQDHVPRKRGP